MSRTDATIRLFLQEFSPIDAFRGMVMIAKRSSLAVALLLVAPAAALALGLGDIHVSSRLDQPLDARIPVLDLTPGTLQSLTVRIASDQTFAQYGLSRPAYLDGARAKIIHTADGRVVVQLTSDQPVTDPVLTLLVKASWDRGVLIREFTLLLSPPVYVPNQGHATQAVAPPVTGTGQREGTVQPPAAAQSPPPQTAAPVSAEAAPPAGQPHSLRVHSGQTLSGIASRVSGTPVRSGRTSQWMVAIYQTNPQAFDHNMNLLRAGAVLSIPARSAVAEISPASASSEILRQNQAWQGAAQARAGSSPGRLRLVAPKGGGQSASAGGRSPGNVQALKAQVQTLQSELAREKRLVQLKSAALAQLQAQSAAQPAAKTTAAAPAAPPAPVPAQPPGHALTAAPVAGHAPARVSMKSHPPVQSPSASQPSRPGSLLGTLRTYWWAVAALVALVLGLLAARLLRSRKEQQADEGFLAGAAAADSGEHDYAVTSAPALARTAEGFDVGEATREHPHFAAEEGVAPLVARHVTADETISSETALNLEQGDPLAEADFHMAYGLYDQAADLIRIAIQREPERRDLKLKLLEVYFVWGNKEQFVQTAHELAESRAEAAPGEWEKVVIMGRQLAPDDPLFADAAVSGAASAGVDLDLEGGQARVDFDPMGSGFPGSTGGAASSTGSFDLDFGAALGETDSHVDTGTVTDLNAALPELESTATETGLTREMPEHLAGAASEGNVDPTVEQPVLPLAEHAALRQKVEALSPGSDRTAELAIDDLGLDLGAFETVLQPGLGADGADAPTLVAGLDEQSRRVLAQADAAGATAVTPGPTGTTSAWQIDETELESLLSSDSHEGHDASATSRLTALDAPEVDFDLGADAGHAEGNGHSHGNGLDFDVGSATATVPHADLTGGHGFSVDSELSDLEPVTPSEVGTKLDLARAYMDMGDPEGARSILEEVMHEGSDSQRQEAGRLLESLPG